MNTPAPSTDPTLTSFWPHAVSITVGGLAGWFIGKALGASLPTVVIVTALVTDAMHWVHAKVTS